MVAEGTKHVERIMDTSKISISTKMFTITADSSLLSPLVCYKAEHLYNSLTNNEPVGCQYECTKSGWFYTMIFERWFTGVIIPYCQRQDPDKIHKLMIGDNLAHYISLYILKLCRIHNVRFALLPPNSTYLIQPLDIVLFCGFEDE